VNLRRRIFLFFSGLAALAAAFFFFRPQPAKPPPNVILFVADTLAAKHMSLYGYHRPTTPNLEEFAKDAFVFDEALAASSYTLASHMTLFTGLPVVRHGMVQVYPEDRNDILAPSIPTLAERLKKMGYATAWFAHDRNEHLPLNRGFERGFDLISDPGGDMTVVNSEREAWLKANRDRPKFIFWHNGVVHEPYAPQKEFYGKFDGGEVKRRIRSPSQAESAEAFQKQFDFENPTDLKRLQSLYDEEILQLDHWFASVFRFLKENGLYENTAIIVTADHGEAFKEHGEIFHRTLNREVLWVPLIVRAPGMKPGRSPAIAQAIDIVPTVLDLLNLPPARDTEGRSLKPALQGRAVADPEFAFAEYSRTGPYSIQNKKWHRSEERRVGKECRSRWSPYH
jgi:arylsulfatase A-like enzyme